MRCMGTNKTGQSGMPRLTRIAQGNGKGYLREKKVFSCHYNVYRAVAVLGFGSQVVLPGPSRGGRGRKKFPGLQLSWGPRAHCRINPWRTPIGFELQAKVGPT